MINQQKRRAIHQQTQDLLIARVSKIQTESALVIMATVFASSGCTICQASNVMFCSLALTHSYWQNSKHSVCIFISAISETRKNAGNDAFSKGDFVKAINLYTEGIEVKSKDEDLNAKLYNNRASAHYHLGKVSFILYYSTHCQHCVLFRIQHSIVYSASLPFYVKTLLESQFNCLSWPY